MFVGQAGRKLRRCVTQELKSFASENRGGEQVMYGMLHIMSVFLSSTSMPKKLQHSLETFRKALKKKRNGEFIVKDVLSNEVYIKKTCIKQPMNNFLIYMDF